MTGHREREYRHVAGVPGIDAFLLHWGASVRRYDRAVEGVGVHRESVAYILRPAIGRMEGACSLIGARH